MMTAVDCHSYILISRFWKVNDNRTDSEINSRHRATLYYRRCKKKSLKSYSGPAHKITIKTRRGGGPQLISDIEKQPM